MLTNKILSKDGKFTLTVNKMWDRHPALIDGMLSPSDYSIRTLRTKYANTNYNSELFSEISIETVSRCNGKCSFCPVSVQNEQRPYMKMSDEMWNKRIDQLKEVGFKGTIFPYANNEIFLDKKIFDRLEYARKVLGEDVRISAESNGKLLVQKNNKGLKMIERLAKYCDQLIINDYSDNEDSYLNFNPRIRYILENLDSLEFERDFTLGIVHRLETQLLNNRFGMVGGIERQQVPQNELFCDFPFFQININPQGDMFICCRDAYFQETIGNINQDSILKIWFGERYREIRDSFVDNKRICDVCKKCTSSGTLTC